MTGGLRAEWERGGGGTGCWGGGKGFGGLERGLKLKAVVGGVAKEGRGGRQGGGG